MPRDAELTRRRLLAAARTEFAEHGIGGGRVDRIAEAAGVNKQRIYGHFGSKEKLFEEVVADALAERTAALGLPGDDLGEFVGRVYDFHRDHPELLRLFLWEALHRGGTADASDDPRAQPYAAKVTALDDALGLGDRGASGALFLTLIGLGAWPHAVPQLTGLLADEDLRDHLVGFARALGQSRTSV